MIILMTFLEILENFADIIYTSEKQKSNYLVFFVFLKFLCMQPKRRSVPYFMGQIPVNILLFITKKYLNMYN